MGSSCSTTQCPQTEACCMSDGSCLDVPEGACSGIGHGPGSTCAETLCPLPQACCLYDGACEDVPPDVCYQHDGFPGGFGSTCGDTGCAF
jgi:hypothetical protein